MSFDVAAIRRALQAGTLSERDRQDIDKYARGLIESMLKRMPDEEIAACNAGVGYLEARIEELRAALEQSVKLQAHYAGLLNQYDGGHRKAFQGRPRMD